MKKVILSSLIFTVLFLLLPLNETVDAATKTSEKQQLIPMYNPNGGGFLASIRLVSYTRVDNTVIPNNSKQKGIKVGLIEASTKKYSYTQCGGMMDVVSVKIGSKSIPLKTPSGNFWGDASYVYKRKDSGGVYLIVNKGTQTIKSTVQFYPTPSKCMGGGSMTDTFTFNNN